MRRHRIAQTRLPAAERVPYLAGFAAGLAMGRAVARPSPRHMPHLRTFQRALASTRGAVISAILAARMQARYDTLFATRPRFAHPALRWHLTSQILPGLALYQTLKEDAAQRGAAPAEALVETGTVLERLDMVGPLLRRMRRLPGATAMFRLVVRASLLLFPSQGWDLRLEEQSSRRIAFTIHRCFYLDVLTTYGAPELTAQYCHLDDVAYRELPASLRWERTTTLARGGPSCDFCWRVITLERANAIKQAANDH